MGISAWSTGSPRQEAEPSVSIKRRTLSFSISMYLEMTRIMSFLISLPANSLPYLPQGEASAGIWPYLWNVWSSRCFTPPMPASAPGPALQESLWPRRGIRWGYSALRACGIHSGKPVRRRTLFLPRVLPD